MVLSTAGIELLGGWLPWHWSNEVQILWSITAIASLFVIVFILTRQWSSPPFSPYARTPSMLFRFRRRHCPMLRWSAEPLAVAHAGSALP